MHHIDRDTPWEEIWQAMELLVQQGKVIYVGSSNFAGWHIARANEAAARRNFLGLVSEQSHYSLVERTVELEVLPACQAYGLGFIPWSPLASGALAGSGRRAGSGGRRERSVGAGELARHRPKLEAFERFCGELGEEPADVALAWLLAKPAVTGPIIGPRTREQLDGGVRALDIQLDAKQIAKLDEIFPGPGSRPPRPTPGEGSAAPATSYIRPCPSTSSPCPCPSRRCGRRSCPCARGSPGSSPCGPSCRPRPWW